jgi:hypothetical protein
MTDKHRFVVDQTESCAFSVAVEPKLVNSVKALEAIDFEKALDT